MTYTRVNIPQQKPLKLSFLGLLHTHTPSSTIIIAYYFWLTRALKLHIVDPNTIKTHASLACPGWYPVYSCLSSRLHSGERQLSKCCSYWWILVTVLTASCSTPVPSAHCGVPQQPHRYSHTDTYTTKNTQTHAADTHVESHTLTLPANLWLNIWWMVLWGTISPLNAPFLSPPPLPGYCVHIQTRYWVKNHTNLRTGDIWH